MQEVEKKTGRPSNLSYIMTEEGTEEVLEKVREGCSDIDIYKPLHMSALTFRKWRDAHIKEYDEAKTFAQSNMLSLAESALQAKLRPRVVTETEILYNEDGSIKSKRVKEKELDIDSLTAMFVAKAGNPELWNPAEWRRLKNEEKGSDKLAEVARELSGYNLSKYKEPEHIEPPVDF